MDSYPALALRLGIRAVSKAKEWATTAPHYRGEHVFGAPTVFAVYGDSVGCGLGVTALDRTFAGVVARRLSVRCGPVTCRIAAVSGAMAVGLPEQRVAGDESFAAVSVGTNDLLNGVRREEFERDLAAFLGRLNHSRRVVVLGPGNLTAMAVLPALFRPLMRNRMLAYEESIRRVAAKFSNARHVGPSLFGSEIGPEDFAEDGFHPSDHAHRRIGEFVWSRLSDALDYPTGA